MKNIILFIGLLFYSLFINSQNLVINPSFENVGTVNCDLNNDGADFDAESQNWTSPITNTSPDIMDMMQPISCFSYPLSTTAAYAPGPQIPRTGNRMAHQIYYAGNAWYKEIIQGELSSPLDPTKQYKVEFYVSLCEDYQEASNAFEVLFTTSAISGQNATGYSPTPQLTYSGSEITDKTNWTLIEFDFCPTEAYTHFQLGNLSGNFSSINTGSGTQPFSGYYTDDVSIIEIPSPDPVLTFTNPSCGLDDGTITISGFNANTSYDITYNDDGTTVGPTSLTSDTNGDIIITGLDAGVYNNFIIGLACPIYMSDILTLESAEGVSVLNIVSSCLASNSEYIVTFDITDGDAATYVVTPAGGTLTGSSYTSENISSGTAYSFTVTDQYGCSPVVVSGTQDCLCPVVGNVTGDATICTGASSDITFNYSGGEEPYSIVYTDGTDEFTINGLTGTSTTVSVSPTSTTIYSIVSISDINCTGTNSGSAIITINPLPDLSLSANTDICTGTSTNISINFTGTAPFSFTYNDGGTPVTQSGINDNPYSISVSPTSNTTYTFTQIDDASCSNTINENITINIHDGVSIINISDICLIGNENYEVSFDIIGGDPTSYTVTPSGNLSGSSFTSNPITSATNYSFVIDDTWGCNPQTINGFRDCSCPVTAVISGSTSVCKDDITQVTVELSGGTFPYDFSYTDGVNNYDITNVNASPYTINITAVNSQTLSLLSVNDINCSGSYSGVANITVNPKPEVYLTGDIDICAGENANLLFSLIGEAPFNITYSDGANTYTENNIMISPFSIDVSPPTNTTYTVLTVTDANCDGIANGTAEVTVFTAPAINTGSEQLICYGESVTLTASGAESYSWFPSYGLSNNVGETVIAGPGVTTEYTVIGINGPGCQGVSTVTVNVDKVVVEIPYQTSLCNGEILTLQPSVTDGVDPYTYLWEETGITTSNITQQMYEDQSFTVVVTDLNGCEGSSSINIHVHDSLHLNVYSNVDSVCPGDTILVNASIYGGTGSPYTLSIDGEYVQTISKIQILEDHDYIFVVEDGCMQVTDTLRLNVFPIPYIDFTADKYTICENESVMFNAIVEPNNLAQSYRWNFGDEDNNNLSLSDNPIHIYKNQGLFDVSLDITTINACKVTLQKRNYINVNPLPLADFKPEPETVSVLNSEIYFNNLTENASSYYWSFNTSDESNIENPFYKFNSVGNYEVSLVAMTNFGCVDTITRFVSVKPEITIWFPNAFTPDGDNINDFFFPKGTNIIKKDYLLTIYDRWGEPIFETDNLHQEWDGKAKGNDYVKPGIYVFTARYKDIYEIAHEHAGTINVIR